MAAWILPGRIFQSCDVFFYTLAERLGIGRIAKWATLLGLGQRTHIDLPQEVTGVMPSEEWKIKNFKQKWYAGETISVGIGQGAVATTPIQLVRAIGGDRRRAGCSVVPMSFSRINCRDNLKQKNEDFPCRPKSPSTRKTGRPSPTPWPRWSFRKAPPPAPT